MSWSKVLAESSLLPGERKVVAVGSRNILVLNHEGTFYAVDNVCPHFKLKMEKGKITPDGTIVCPWHRSEFDLCSGLAKKWTPWPPVVGKIMSIASQSKPLQVFQVRVEEGNIWVEVEQH
ncbi:hypothetical protein RINTHH_14270 [Richelia intracellularis HH01]|jgi:nitrite reductase/ring-hydroxylating ferredoxin subunit|uniref:Rieske domain-containing protein n=1 Tax=Richelia intracellularis HH01 TaxID=1165094 RepID=M1WZG9_9NOST|nr:Rieske (2Fe-2S) protein [Richelia intracellularis]CCH67582.1 hypothetical protein RINTHH_14270 [Richelia intracellularis HH01]